MQELKSNGHQAQRTFGEWARNEIATDPSFHKKTIINNFDALGVMIIHKSIVDIPLHCLLCSTHIGRGIFSKMNECYSQR